MENRKPIQGLPWHLILPAARPSENITTITTAGDATPTTSTTMTTSTTNRNIFSVFARVFFGFSRYLNVLNPLKIARHYELNIMHPDERRLIKLLLVCVELLHASWCYDTANIRRSRLACAFCLTLRSA